MQTFYIYKTTFPDGRVYIGKHSWCGDGLDPNYFGSGNCVRRFKADHPYDWKNLLQTEILAHVEDESYLNEIERLFVYQAKKEFGSLCVNLADGGDGQTSSYMKNYWASASEERVKKQQEIGFAKYKNNLDFTPRFGADNGMYGKHASKRQKEAARKTCLERWKDEEFVEKSRSFFVKMKSDVCFQEKRIKAINMYKTDKDRMQAMAKKVSEACTETIRETHRLFAKKCLVKKYLWLSSDGSIRVMDAGNVKQHHPDWIMIGPQGEVPNPYPWLLEQLNIKI